MFVPKLIYEEETQKKKNVSELDCVFLPCLCLHIAQKNKCGKMFIKKCDNIINQHRVFSIL